MDRVGQNLRTEAHFELKQATKAWTECVTNNFMPKWLAGEKLDINEVCAEENERRVEADGALYEEKPIPFRTFAIPQ